MMMRQDSNQDFVELIELQEINSNQSNETQDNPKQNTPAEAINILIRAINKVIQENPNTIRENYFYAKIVLEGITKFIGAQVPQAVASNEKSILILKEIKKEDLKYFTAYQSLEVIKKIQTKMSEQVSEMNGSRLYFTKNSIKDDLLIALNESATMHEALFSELEKNKPAYEKQAEENLKYNNENFPLNFDLYANILFFTTPFEKKKYARVAKLFNTHLQSLWIDEIKQKFNLTNEDIKSYKKENESLPQFYNRLSQVQDLCVKIREKEREQMIQQGHVSQADRYKQTKESHKTDLLEGLLVGVAKLEDKYNALFPTMDSYQMPFMYTGFVYQL